MKSAISRIKFAWQDTICSALTEPSGEISWARAVIGGVDPISFLCQSTMYTGWEEWSLSGFVASGPGWMDMACQD